ncbi:MAG TPA: hypothetical protein VMW25_02885, partial [Clostridia bacterium]|nr:hypothetical protein [Clostridia bacterium]
MKVNVESIGILEFPDGTDMAVIQSTVEKVLAEKNGNQKTFMDKYLPSLKRVGEIYKEEVTQGEAAMEKATSKPTGKNILGGVLGALQWGMAPLTAGVKGIVREPIQQGLEDVGVPKGAADFAGEMVETAAYFLPYGKAVQTAIKGGKAMEEAKLIGKAAEQMKGLPKTTSKALEFPEGLSKGAIADAVKPISEANQKILKTAAVDDIIKELKPAMQGWNPAEKRITQEIVDYMVNNP